MPRNQMILLASRPKGQAGPENFALVEADVPEPAEGQVLVRHRFLSLDPYMRGRMNDSRSYAAAHPLGEVMIGGTAGEVAASRNPRFKAGDLVAGMGGWQLYGLSDGRDISIVRDWKQGDEQTRAFLRDVHGGACQYFTTVLGPGADVFHYNHIHLDLAMHGNTSTGPRRACKPLPQNQPPPRKLDDLPDPPVIEEEQDVAQAAPLPRTLAVPPAVVATHRAAPGPGPLALMPRRINPPGPVLPQAGEMGDDGVFVPESLPDDQDRTSAFAPRRR